MKHDCLPDSLSAGVITTSGRLPESGRVAAMSHHTRRDFCRMVTSGAAALSYALLTGGCECLRDAIRNRPIRRCIRPRDAAVAQDLAVYADAVKAMKALPSTDPRNWTKQAEIHLNSCQHGSWFFFPWHRAYLLYFERICRKLTGVSNWGLPYWNWSEMNRIPTAFWSGELLHTPRTATASSTANSTVVGPTALENILNQPNFNVFAGTSSSSGTLEGSPHNYIHNFVGGTMGSYMSPLDPVFWCHHNMVEYCWVDWNINRNYANTNDAAWANHSFNGHFVDADGAPVNIAVAVTLLFPLLSYRYEPCGMGLMTRDVLSKIDAADFRKLREALTKGKEVRLDFRRQLEVASGFTLETGGKFSRPVSDFSAADLNRILASDSPERSLLTVEHEQLPETGDIFVRVFVNKPDAGPETTVDDPHYAGSVYYFVDPAAHRDHGGGRAVPTFLVDVTETIRRLSRSGERVDPGRFSVQLVLAPFEGRRPPPINLRIRSLRLGLSAIKIVPTV